MMSQRQKYFCRFRTSSHNVPSSAWANDVCIHAIKFHKLWIHNTCYADAARWMSRDSKPGVCVCGRQVWLWSTNYHYLFKEPKLGIVVGGCSTPHKSKERRDICRTVLIFTFNLRSVRLFCSRYTIHQRKTPLRRSGKTRQLPGMTKYRIIILHSGFVFAAATSEGGGKAYRISTSSRGASENLFAPISAQIETQPPVGVKVFRNHRRNSPSLESTTKYSVHVRIFLCGSAARWVGPAHLPPQCHLLMINHHT